MVKLNPSKYMQDMPDFVVVNPHRSCLTSKKQKLKLRDQYLYIVFSPTQKQK